jgi:hypothetical protein
MWPCGRWAPEAGSCPPHSWPTHGLYCWYRMSPFALRLPNRDSMRTTRCDAVYIERNRIAPIFWVEGATRNVKAPSYSEMFLSTRRQGPEDRSKLVDPKEFWQWCGTLRIAGFLDFVHGRYSKKLGNTTFRKLDLFLFSGEGETPTLSGPLGRANFNHWSNVPPPQPEDGKRSSFRKVVLSSFLDNRTMEEVKNAAIPSVQQLAHGSSIHIQLGDHEAMRTERKVANRSHNTKCSNVHLSRRRTLWTVFVTCFVIK